MTTNKELLEIIKQADPDAPVDISVMIGDHELAPVIHSKWTYDEDTSVGDGYCGHCGYKPQRYPITYKFCPECGARMDGE